MSSIETTPAQDKIDAILLCGGKGSRLQALLRDSMPKSLYEINGYSLMQHTLASLPPDNVGRLIFAVDHKSDQIIDWVEEAGLPHDSVAFSYQSGAGIMGAVSAALEQVRSDRFVICNTDEVREGLELEDMIRFHGLQNLIGTMAVGYADKLYNHRVLILGDDKKIISSHLKVDEYKSMPDSRGPVNTGFLLLEREAVEHFDTQESQGWGAIIDPLVRKGLLGAFVVENMRYCNAGTPEEVREIDPGAVPITAAVQPAV